MVRWWQTRVNTIPLFDSGEKTLLPKSVLTISCAKPNQLFAVFLCRQRSFSLKAKYRSRFLYSVILTEYAAIESRVCVYMYACMCVCVYVCAYVVCASVSVCVCMCVTALHPKRMDGFWWNFLHMIWQIFARSVFLGFWKFEIVTSWRSFCLFSFAAL